MPIARFYIHRVNVVRPTAVGEDDYGHAITTPVVVAAAVPCSIQPKRLRELPYTSQGGPVVGDWTIYLAPMDVRETDSLVHVAADCPLAVGVDLPDATWQPTGVRNEAGAGHHLAVDAQLISSGLPPVEQAVVEPAGS